MNHPYTISKRRKAELERELHFLQTTRYREVEMMLAEAKQYGDLSESLEYDAAISERELLHRRIKEIVYVINHAVVAEDSCLSDSFLAELTKRIEACGLSREQAEAYAEYCRDGYELWEDLRLGVLPSDACFQTLEEAQKIISQKSDSWHISESEIAKLLQTPVSQWQQAKQAVMECFGCTKDTVDAVFREDVRWLFVTADSVYSFAEYLKGLFPEEAIAWKIYRNAVFPGLETTRNRIGSVLDTLGDDYGRKVIRMDAEHECWLFYMYYTDPAGAIAYMKNFGLTPEKILTVIREKSYILYMYKDRQKRSYGHDQEQIDDLLRGYL